MCRIPVWYKVMCEGKSVIHVKLQQYTTQFNNALCRSLLPLCSACAHTQVCAHAHMNTCTHTYTHMHARMHACMHTHTHTHTCVCMCLHTHTHTHTHSHSHSHTHTTHAHSLTLPLTPNTHAHVLKQDPNPQMVKKNANFNGTMQKNGMGDGGGSFSPTRP